MSIVTPFSEEQAPALINLEQRYEVWIDAERTLAALPYGMQKKVLGGKVYLYEIRDRVGNGRSLGPWSDIQERILAAYRSEKEAAKLRSATSKARLDESGMLGPPGGGDAVERGDDRDL